MIGQIAGAIMPDLHEAVRAFARGIIYSLQRLFDKLAGSCGPRVQGSGKGCNRPVVSHEAGSVQDLRKKQF